MVARFPAVNSYENLPYQVMRMRMRSLEIARTEMGTIVAELRIREALRSRVTPAARYILASGAKVRVYLETDNKITGPYTVIGVQDKDIFIDRNGKRVHRNMSQAISERTLTGDTGMNELRLKLQSFSDLSCPRSRIVSKKEKHRMLCLRPSNFNNRSSPSLTPPRKPARILETKKKEVQGLIEIISPARTRHVRIRWYRDRDAPKWISPSSEAENRQALYSLFQCHLLRIQVKIHGDRLVNS